MSIYPIPSTLEVCEGKFRFGTEAGIYAETAAGRPIEYKADGRVKVNDYKKRRK